MSDSTANNSSESAEKQLAEKVAALEEQLSRLQVEIKVSQGRAKSISPAQLQAAKTENEALKRRLALMEKALQVALRDPRLARRDEDLKLQTESLRLAAIELFGKLGIDAELWKNIAS